jgi:uroporphyrinogen-III synthase
MPSTGVGRNRSGEWDFVRVLVTRPAEDAARTVAALAARGHAAVCAPLFAVRRLAATWPADAAAVVATSANAIRGADQEALSALTDRPCFTVGATTAKAARSAGFTNLIVGDGDGAELARRVADRLPAGTHVLCLAGRPRRDEALAALENLYRLTVAETYETIACESLPLAAAEALRLGNLDAVLHFSPRAARVFGDLAASAGLLPEAQALLHVFISEAAADLRFARRSVAARPNLESMVAAL